MKRNNDHLSLVKKGSVQPRWKKALRFISRLALVSALLLLLWQGESYFRVNDIRVEGSDEIEAADIIAAAGIKEGSSIWMLREERIAGRIYEQLPQVKNVELSRILPDQVVVRVSERIPEGYIMTADGFWVIDRDTVSFANVQEPLGELPLITGVEGEMVIPGVPLDCRQRREALKSFFAGWKENSWFEIRQIDLSDSFNLIIYTAEGLEIWLGDGKDMERKMELVQQSIPHIAADPETRIDVRSGNRLVVSGTTVTKEKEVEP